jgi:hypothetical protein
MSLRTCSRGSRVSRQGWHGYGSRGGGSGIGRQLYRHQPSRASWKLSPLTESGSGAVQDKEKAIRLLVLTLRGAPEVWVDPLAVPNLYVGRVQKDPPAQGLRRTRDVMTKATRLSPRRMPLPPQSEAASGAGAKQDSENRRQDLRLARGDKERGRGKPHIDTRLAPAYAENRMEIHLTPDQKAFVRQAIESGRLHREEDAVHTSPEGRWHLLRIEDVFGPLPH